MAVILLSNSFCHEWQKRHSALIFCQVWGRVFRVKKVAVLVQDGVEPFGLGAMCEVWAEPYHPEDDNPVFDFVVATPRPGRVRGPSGYDLHVENGLDAAGDADLVCVTPKRGFRDPSPEVVELLQHVHARGAHVFAHCTAAFILGEAGLLDGRRCTTHWRHVDDLRALYPEALVDGDVLYVQDGNIVTGAGSAAGLDAALHLMRQQFGSKTAAAAARRMVVPPHRDGGQAQYISRPVTDCSAETLGPLLTWITENLSEDVSVEALARRNHMSPRTFARRFRDETGTTPHAWVTQQRLHAAEELLERTDNSVDWIAAEVGFGNAAALRHHFTRARGVSPQQYRRTFAAKESA
jgi:transcriptional regulator GlxA family with amidase domain